MDALAASTSRQGYPSSSLDKITARGDGMVFYPSGNIAVIVCFNPEGQLVTFMSDSLNSQVLANFDYRGVGSCNYPNGKPWLVVSVDGYTLSDRKGFIVERGSFPRTALTPIRLELSDCLTITFVDRQNITADFRCEDVAKTFQCGEQLRRSESYLNKVTSRTVTGKLELDTDAIRRRQREIGSVYVPKGPHHQVTVQYGTGTLKTLLKTIPQESQILKTINDLEESRARVSLVNTLPKHIYGAVRSKSAGSIADIPDFGSPPMSSIQKQFKPTMRRPDYSRSRYKGKRSALRRLNFKELQAELLGEAAPQDMLRVVVVLADWAPLSHRAEAALQEAIWEFELQAADDSSCAGAFIQGYKMDASESNELQRKYKFRFVPMFFMYHSGKLVYASNNMRNKEEVMKCAVEALTSGRRKDFLPDDFTFGARDNVMLDYIKRDMSLL